MKEFPPIVFAIGKLSKHEFIEVFVSVNDIEKIAIFSKIEGEHRFLRLRNNRYKEYINSHIAPLTVDHIKIYEGFNAKRIDYDSDYEKFCRNLLSELTLELLKGNYRE